MPAAPITERFDEPLTTYQHWVVYILLLLWGLGST
jgi:hypothetical protein